MLQPIRFEDLITQHAKQTLEAHTLLLLIEACDVEVSARMQHGSPDLVRRSVPALTVSNSRRGEVRRHLTDVLIREESVVVLTDFSGSHGSSASEHKLARFHHLFVDTTLLIVRRGKYGAFTSLTNRLLRAFHDACEVDAHEGCVIVG